jgi:hypothetical protein
MYYAVENNGAIRERVESVAHTTRCRSPGAKCPVGPNLAFQPSRHFNVKASGPSLVDIYGRLPSKGLHVKFLFLPVPGNSQELKVYQISTASYVNVCVRVRFLPKKCDAL